MNNVSEIRDICEQSGRVLEAHGYTPDYGDEREFFFCDIGGAEFSFCQIDDRIFGYSAEFKLAGELTDDVENRITELFTAIVPDDVTFENLYFSDNSVVLSSAFYFDMYEEEMIELAVKTLEAADGIAAYIRARM